jgi:hypothetical protein
MKVRQSLTTFGPLVRTHRKFFSKGTVSIDIYIIIYEIWLILYLSRRGNFSNFCSKKHIIHNERKEHAQSFVKSENRREVWHSG